MRRIILLAAVCLPGCMLPYAVPSVSYVPPFDLECPAGEVHVFRVNITHEHFSRASDRDNELCELREVGADGIKKTPGQTSVACTHGVGVGGLGSVTTSHTIAVRLYRPGYETVELNSWDPPGKAIWKPALTAAVQEMALDELFDLGDKKAVDGEVPAVPRALQPGSKSSAHRDALRFGTAEYAHLAGQVTGKDESQRKLRDRLVEKARRLEQLADADVKPRAQAGP
jgi:hypothetical protein